MIATAIPHGAFGRPECAPPHHQTSHGGRFTIQATSNEDCEHNRKSWTRLKSDRRDPAAARFTHVAPAAMMRTDRFCAFLRERPVMCIAAPTAGRRVLGLPWCGIPWPL